MPDGSRVRTAEPPAPGDASGAGASRPAGEPTGAGAPEANPRRGLLGVTAVLVVVTTFGRALGLLRDLVMAKTYGASAETDAFSVAWMIPETVTPLLLEGAMVFVLVPLFSRGLAEEGSVRPLVMRTAVPVGGTLLVLSVLTALSAHGLVAAFSPGLDPRAENLAAGMVAIASSCVFSMGFAGYMRAALNASGVFGITGTVYAAYNAGILAGVLLLSATLGITGAAVGLALGGVFMVLVQLGAFVGLLRSGKAAQPCGPRYPFETSTRTPKVGGRPRLLPDRNLLGDLAPILPISLFVLARHSQVYAERFFGSLLEPGAISHLGYATRLAQLPMTTAITAATVGFAVAARAAHSGRTGEAEGAFVGDLRIAMALVAPAAAFLVLLPGEVVEAFFGRGAFSRADVSATADALRAYSIGLFGHAAVYVAALPFFYYRRCLSAAIAAAVAGLCVTAAVDAAFVLGGASGAGARGLALGNAAGITTTAVLLLLVVKRRLLPGAKLAPVARSTAKSLACSAVAALPSHLAASALAGAAGSWAALVCGGLVFLLSYLVLARLAGLDEAKVLIEPVRKKLARWRPAKNPAVPPGRESEDA